MIEVELSHKTKDSPFYRKYKKWVETKSFREAGLRFEAEGQYCPFPLGSVSYNDFWDEEEFRIKNGYSYKNQRIAGLHYLYLNYCPIWNKKEKKYKFPDFRASDAEWFLAIEKDLGLAHWNNDPNRPVGHVDGKSRQVGHSLKAVVPLLYFMNFVRGSKCYLGAVEEKYAVKTLKMYLKYHDHLYEYTDLGKGWLEKQKNKYYKTGFIDVVNGQNVEKGYLSELSIVTFQDTAEKGVGGGCDLFIIEEAGLFPQVLDAIGYITPACKDGDLTTGNILVFGAAGDLKNCKQYEKLCLKPTDYDFAGYPNYYEEGKLHELIAYFIPNYSCRPPYIDEDGNPDVLAAIQARDRSLANLKKTNFKKWAQDVSQFPNTVKEMFDLRGQTRFQKHIIEPHLAMLKANVNTVGTKVMLFEGPGGVAKYTMNVPDDVTPILDYPHTDKDNRDGCVLIYEFPNANPQWNLHIASIDSYNQDDSTTDSLGSIFIYKQASSLSEESGGRYLVAEYVGRPKEGKYKFYERCSLLIKLYNAHTMVENEDQELVPWFFNRGLSHYLADQPDIIRSIVKSTAVKRSKGIHAVTPLIVAAENKIQRYLEEKIGFYYNDEGEVIGEKLGVTRIPSIGLLNELVKYTSDDGENYDRERSFGWLLMFEEELYTNPVQEDYDENFVEFLNQPFQ